MSGTTVAVSGITGFIGSHITAKLLRAGYTVHGTLRSNKPEKIAHLPTDAPGTLNVFEADLLTEGAFDEATKGCKYALHVASPYKLEYKDAYKELIEPAVKGTLNFLRSCVANKVEKVVLTSSLAAVADRAREDGRPVDEQDWNSTSSEKLLPYYYSKAEAEREAWKFATEHQLNLVVINPVAVMGPSMTRVVGESAAMLMQIEKGLFGGIVDFEIPVVDVRDVADAHIRAMESDSAKGRYICAPLDCVLSIRDITRLLQDEGFQPPTRDLTNPILTRVFRMVSPYIPGGTAGQVTSLQIGRALVPNTQKIANDLGMEFISAEKAVTDTLIDLIKWGHLEKPNTREI